MRTTSRRPRSSRWPPVIGVSLLVPVGADRLAVADLRGMLMLPGGGVYERQAPEDAAHRVLSGPPGGLRLLRRVAVDWVQARRRKVITHVLATAPMTREAVGHLIYRDPRATVRVLPTMRVIDDLPTQGRLRVLVGLQALATGETASIEGGVVLPSAPPTLTPEWWGQRSPGT
ncbi:hypothetical protein ACFV8Z_45475 [Streptomyces sp. NPDC059837]|uniref:hypothetical protein n=1 Tax=Streptomyces sp. NPDC059837 TaxID=3346968 RepID=UPI003665BFCC